MRTDKFIGLLLDNGIKYRIDDQNRIYVFTGSNMSQNYYFAHDPVNEVVDFQHTVCKRMGNFRFGTDIGERFLRNLEFVPHRITGKRKASK